MMWESQWGRQQKSILPVEPHCRGLKRKLFKPEGGVEKARRMDEIDKRVQIDEIDSGLNKVRLEKIRLEIEVQSCMPIYGRGSSNMLKREARFGPDLAGKMRISFEDKYEAVGGAGESAGGEYTQIWERNTLVARRCLGKGRAVDKLVLDAAIWIIQCSEEEKAGVPMVSTFAFFTILLKCFMISFKCFWAVQPRPSNYLVLYNLLCVCHNMYSCNFT